MKKANLSLESLKLEIARVHSLSPDQQLVLRKLKGKDDEFEAEHLKKALDNNSPQLALRTELGEAIEQKECDADAIISCTGDRKRTVARPWPKNHQTRGRNLAPSAQKNLLLMLKSQLGRLSVTNPRLPRRS